MIRSKKCFKCNQEKPLAEFYVHKAMADGYLNKCKECAKNDVAKHRIDNIERIRAYDRERAKHPDRIKANVEITRQWRAEDKRRQYAHGQVSKAIKKGTLVRMPCVKCADPKSEAHHEDYDKPLDVVWLCSICHHQRHQEIRKLFTF